MLQTKTIETSSLRRVYPLPTLLEVVDLGFRVAALEPVEPLRLSPGIRREVQVGTGDDGDNYLRPHWHHPGVRKCWDTRMLLRRGGYPRLKLACHIARPSVYTPNPLPHKTRLLAPS